MTCIQKARPASSAAPRGTCYTFPDDILASLPQNSAFQASCVLRFYHQTLIAPIFGPKGAETMRLAAI